MSNQKTMSKTAEEVLDLYKNDFENAVKTNEVLQQIAEMANNTRDISDFGYQVAYILKSKGIISPAVYSVLTGEL